MMPAEAMLFSSLGIWDIVLIIAVSIQATAMAYFHHPQAKALVYSMPLPFTFAALALGHPIGAANVAGLVLLVVYAHAVRWIHLRLQWPISLAIALAAFLYAAFAVPLAVIAPSTPIAFWIMAAGALALGALLLKGQPSREEPGHRTPLPIWIKLPITVAVVCALVLMKKHLGGFVTTFPMVGIVGAYEARHSLWTWSRQVAIILLTVTPLAIGCFLTQGVLGLPFALAVGWLAFGASLALVSWHAKRQPDLAPVAQP